MLFLACVNLRDAEVETVVQGAAWAAERAQATVDLLFVDDIVLVPTWISDPLSSQLLSAQWDASRREHEERLQALREHIPEAHRGKAVRVEGRPVEEILRLSVDYDGIVLVDRRHTAIGRALIGSVASRVARSATVPVVVVPAHGALRERPVCAAPRALLGVDLRGPHATVGLAEATKWATELGLLLDILYVDTSRLHVPYISDPDVRHRFDQEWQSLQERDIETLGTFLADVPHARRGLPRIEEGEPAEVLCDLAAEYELVIVITHGRTGVDRLMMGSVAEKVMHACPRPLLLLRLAVSH